MIWNTQGEECFHLCCRRGGAMDVRDAVWWRDVLAVADNGGHVALYRISSVHLPASEYPFQCFHLLR